MSFSLELSEDVIEVRDWVHSFADQVVRPAAAEWDEREETPWPIIQEAAKVGLYSMELFAAQAAEPSGIGMLTVFEELFWGDAGIALSILGTGLAAASLAATGTPEQLGEWLPQMFGSIAEPQLGSFCASEPGAGSDVAAIITRARYQEATDEWLINGTKTWATNGGIANVHIVVASVDPELGSRGQATFIIPPGTKGFSQGQKFKKHGIRASHTAEVVLDDVRIPGRLIIGGKDKFDERIARTKEGKSSAGQAAMKTFERTRPSVGAMALGVARAAYEYALDYAKNRKAFGEAIGQRQAIAFMLAEMATEIEAARLLVWEAAWLLDQGREAGREAYLAHNLADDMALMVADRAVQILGGHGYIRDYPVELWLRDARAFAVLEGLAIV
jgi:acyl-CoA dehydrogenase